MSTTEKINPVFVTHELSDEVIDLYRGTFHVQNAKFARIGHLILMSPIVKFKHGTVLRKTHDDMFNDAINDPELKGRVLSEVRNAQEQRMSSLNRDGYPSHLNDAGFVDLLSPACGLSEVSNLGDRNLVVVHGRSGAFTSPSVAGRIATELAFEDILDPNKFLVTSNLESISR